MPLPRHSPSPPRQNMHCGFTEEMDERVPGWISAAAGMDDYRRSRALHEAPLQKRIDPCPVGAIHESPVTPVNIQPFRAVEGAGPYKCHSERRVESFQILRRHAPQDDNYAGAQWPPAAQSKTGRKAQRSGFLSERRSSETIEGWAASQTGTKNVKLAPTKRQR